jgi:hypothetical protein
MTTRTAHVYLLTTMKVISWYYRLEYGHPSHYSTAKALILTTSLLPLAQEHFPLSPSQLDMLQKLLHWVSQELSDVVTLFDLRQASLGIHYHYPHHHPNHTFVTHRPNHSACGPYQGFNHTSLPSKVVSSHPNTSGGSRCYGNTHFFFYLLSQVQFL